MSLSVSGFNLGCDCACANPGATANMQPATMEKMFMAALLSLDEYRHADGFWITSRCARSRMTVRLVMPDLIRHPLS
jgi:hypothetical protein